MYPKAEVGSTAPSLRLGTQRQRSLIFDGDAGMGAEVEIDVVREVKGANPPPFGTDSVDPGETTKQHSVVGLS